MEINTLNAETKKPSLKKTFLRAQLVSLTSTLVDFTVSILLHELLSIYYVTATTIGSVFGAITSFNLGRNWAFLNRYGKIRKQAFRFIFVSIVSIFVNTTGVFFFKENFEISFVVSRIIVAALIGVLFNFFMNRYFVFK